MCAAANGHIFDGRQRGLFGIDDLQRLDAAFFELVAHDARKRTDGGLVDIRHLKGGGVHLVPGAHAANDGRAAALRLLDELELAGHGVDRVDDVIVLGKVELLRGLRCVKGLIRVDHGLRCDLKDALFGNVHLVLSHGLARGEYLAVQIRQADPVVIDEVERADAAARERLYRVTAHAADAEYRDPRTE